MRPDDEIRCAPADDPRAQADREASVGVVRPGQDRTSMSKKLYVGNLSFNSTEAELKDLFGRHGTVESASVVTDRETGRSRGFAFVEMEAASADNAVRELDGTDFGGRTLKVSEAQAPRGGFRSS
jgi:RNA recognition motif-containing protein